MSWVLRKSGHIGEFSVSINHINESKSSNDYLNPIVVNEKILIRLCAAFSSSQSIMPHSIQFDMFWKNMTMKITPAHIVIVTKLINSLPTKSTGNNNQNDNRESTSNGPSTSTSKL